MKSNEIVEFFQAMFAALPINPASLERRAQKKFVKQVFVSGKGKISLQ